MQAPRQRMEIFFCSKSSFRFSHRVLRKCTVEKIFTFNVTTTTMPSSALHGRLRIRGQRIFLVRKFQELYVLPLFLLQMEEMKSPRFKIPHKQRWKLKLRWKYSTHHHRSWIGFTDHWKGSMNDGVLVNYQERYLCRERWEVGKCFHPRIAHSHHADNLWIRRVCKLSHTRFVNKKARATLGKTLALFMLYREINISRNGATSVK